MIARHLYAKVNKARAAKAVHVFIALLALIILSMFFFSCHKEEKETPKPIEELILTLKSDNSSCTCEPYINQYIWRNKYVYVLVCKGPACNCLPILYNSNGQAFTLDAGYSYDTFLRESAFIKNIWTCQ